MEKTIVALAVFTFYSVCLQSLIDFVRERFANVDGYYVNAVACLVGVTIAFLVPSSRVASTFFGSLDPVTEIIATGVVMALGSKFVARFFRSLETYRMTKSSPDA